MNKTTIKTKEMWRDFELNCCKNLSLSAANAYYNYKKQFKTIKAYKKYLDVAEYEIIRKRFERRENNRTVVELTQKEKILKIKKQMFTLALEKNVRTNAGAVVYNNTIFDYEVKEEADWNYYAKSYRYPKIWKTSVFKINLDAFKLQYRKYLVLDGIVNAEILSVKKYEKYEVVEAVSIIRKKSGFELCCVYIATDGKNHYHSLESQAKAIKGLQRKLKKIEKSMIKPDTLVSVSLYKKITGACAAGVENWLNKHGFDSNVQIPAQKLLHILKEENAYGWEKLRQAIFSYLISL